MQQQIIHTYENNNEYGYYTIGKSYIKYSLEYPISEAYRLLHTGNCGPEFCDRCCSQGMLRGVFVGPCALCADHVFGIHCCDCQLIGHFSQLVDFHQTCGLPSCKVKQIVEKTHAMNIGCNVSSTTYHHHRTKNGTVVSMHIRFEDEEYEEYDEDNGYKSGEPHFHESGDSNDMNPSILSLVHPDICTYDDNNRVTEYSRDGKTKYVYDGSTMKLLWTLEKE
jgi:hypothetical protein